MTDPEQTLRDYLKDNVRLFKDITYKCHVHGFVDCNNQIKIDLSNKCIECNYYYCENHLRICEKCGTKVCMTTFKECKKNHLIRCLSIVVDKQQGDINELKETIKEMNKTLIDLLYAPNGPMYQEAKQNFDSLKN